MLKTIKLTKEQTLSKEFEVSLDSNETVDEAFKQQRWDIPALLKVLQQYIDRDLYQSENKLFRVPKLLELRSACQDWKLIN